MACHFYVARWLVFFRGIFGQRNLSRIVRKNPESYWEYGAGIFTAEAAKVGQDKNFIKRHQLPTDRVWEHGRRVLLVCGLLVCGVIGCDDGSPSTEDGTFSETNDSSGQSDIDLTNLDNSDGTTPNNGENNDKQFIVGTNVTGKAKPGEFTALKDNGDLFVELGFQGSYMVVLALQTRGYVTSKVKITARLVVSGQQKASLTIKNKKLVPGGNGYDYWYNIFVVTEDYVDYQNMPAVVTLALYDAESDVLLVEDSVSVYIRPPK
ncbi:MAG: hypothetical protein HUU55_20390 [Myxococcales bacterium]|nr:hypothetical protein [Myxococcales bacterium]